MNTKLVDRWNQVMMHNYGDKSVGFVRGEGAVLWDADGREYLDFVAGIAVNVLGHGHPAIVEAVTDQVARLGHVSNLYAAEPPVILAERLLDLLAPYGANGRVFFCNSGAEANEAAFKIARLTGRPNIVSALGSFHGRTMGALALTGQPVKHAGFTPLPGPVCYVPYGDVEALRAIVDEHTSAVFLEPIQGEGGVIVPPDGYLRAAREITAEAGALLVLDEVQTGIGRTGEWFAHQHEAVEPDLITLAKGLGGGLPIGACIGFGKAGEMFEKGQHASTFGGSPVACAAALAVLDTIAGEGLLANARARGDQLAAGVKAMTHPMVREVRGRGLMLGVALTEPVAADVQAAAEQAGFLLNAVTPDVLRIAPPLVITEAQVDALLDAFADFFP